MDLAFKNTIWTDLQTVTSGNICLLHLAPLVIHPTENKHNLYIIHTKRILPARRPTTTLYHLSMRHIDKYCIRNITFFYRP